MKTGPGRKRRKRERERDRKSRKIVQNLLGGRRRSGRAVMAEIRAKRNDADARRECGENERGGKRFLLWSRDCECSI